VEQNSQDLPPTAVIQRFLTSTLSISSVPNGRALSRQIIDSRRDRVSGSDVIALGTGKRGPVK
jgi:hypothetical protein